MDGGNLMKIHHPIYGMIIIPNRKCEIDMELNVINEILHKEYISFLVAYYDSLCCGLDKLRYRNV